MSGYLLRRLLVSILLLYLVLSLTFVLAQLAPGQPTDRFFDPRIPVAQSERLAALYGLDQPLAVQYVRWLHAVVVKWDWGLSFVHLEPVTAVIAGFFPNTLVLAAGALFVQYTLGILLGIVAARRPGGVVDHSVRLMTLVLYSVPAFWLGLMLVLLLSHTWHFLPAGSLASLGANQLPVWEQLLDRLRHLILPAFVLGAPFAGEVARFVRNGLLEVLEQDYVRAARARGLAEWRVMWVHALRNAVVALTQVTGFSLGFLLSGSFAVEWVFSWPGLGYMTINAIQANDYPLILASTALTGVVTVLGNLAADLLHFSADPRVKQA